MIGLHYIDPPKWQQIQIWFSLGIPGRQFRRICVELLTLVPSRQVCIKIVVQTVKCLKKGTFQPFRLLHSCIFKEHEKTRISSSKVYLHFLTENEYTSCLFLLNFSIWIIRRKVNRALSLKSRLRTLLSCCNSLLSNVNFRFWARNSQSKLFEFQLLNLNWKRLDLCTLK